MEVTHLIKTKQIKAMHTLKFSQKLKPYTEAKEIEATYSSAKLEMKTTHSANKLINTMFCT